MRNIDDEAWQHEGNQALTTDLFLNQIKIYTWSNWFDWYQINTKYLKFNGTTIFYPAKQLKLCEVNFIQVGVNCLVQEANMFSSSSHAVSSDLSFIFVVVVKTSLWWQSCNLKFHIFKMSSPYTSQCSFTLCIHLIFIPLSRDILSKWGISVSCKTHLSCFHLDL